MKKILVCKEFQRLEYYKHVDIKTIDRFLEREKLDPKKCVRQRWDGYVLLWGKGGTVQKIITEKYRKALFSSLCKPSVKSGSEQPELCH